MEKHPLHLKNPELQKSEEVQDAVEKQERLTGEKIPNNPNERIEAYLGRLEKIFLNPDERVRERNIEMLRPAIYENFLIKPGEVPESYFLMQQRIARERGQTIETIPEDVKKQMIDVAIKDQKHSLDQWIDYLTSDDAAYPAYFKYFVFRNIVKLSQFDKGLGKFKSRTENTIAPYPDIYRAPLAKICDIYEQIAKDNKKLKTDSKLQEQFSKKFPKLYAEFISESLAVRIENKEQVKGEWCKYKKGNKDDAKTLYESVQAKGTGWCIEGKTTSESYIEQGDFYVYYTYDQNENPIQPRIAIQMNGSQIGQIRGILEHQELEPIMSDVLEEKLKEFGPEADAYKKKNFDMKHLTEIEKKIKLGQHLSPCELKFLYEVDNKIECFGYDRDPRIAELREQRNLEEDMLVIFECKKEQIAHNPKEITKNTKAYVGKLEPGIFELIQIYNIEHIYTSFPEGEIKKQSVEIGGKSAEELEKELEKNSINMSNYAKDMLKNKDFTTLKNPERVDIVRLKVSDLGFEDGATTSEIYKKAEELGLELCPAEVGPHLRLQYANQPMNEWLSIGMKQITDRDGYPRVFHLERYGVGLWLYDDWTSSARRWYSVHEFAFRFRKSS